MSTFFTQLSQIVKGFDLNMNISNNADGTMSVSVLPKKYSESEKGIPAVVLTATPQELDEAFIAKLTQPLQNAGLLIHNLKSFESAITKATKDAEAKASAKKKSTSTTSSTTTALNKAVETMPNLFSQSNS